MKLIKIFSTCLFLFFFVSCKQVANTESDASIEKRVEALLYQMTLEEKIGQMNQISPSGEEAVIKELVKKGEVGSILNIVDPVVLNALQKVAVEESRGYGSELLQHVFYFDDFKFSE